MSKPFRIAIDFDGTIVKHRYPDIGAAVPGAIAWLHAWQKAGAILYLWTMRSDGMKDGDTLTQAVEYCRMFGIEFSAVNRNESDHTWTNSPKLYAQVYVDDAAIGCPLVKPLNDDERPWVDWEIVGPAVLKMIHANTR